MKLLCGSLCSLFLATGSLPAALFTFDVLSGTITTIRQASMHDHPSFSLTASTGLGNGPVTLTGTSPVYTVGGLGLIVDMPFASTLVLDPSLVFYTSDLYASAGFTLSGNGPDVHFTSNEYNGDLTVGGRLNAPSITVSGLGTSSYSVPFLGSLILQKFVPYPYPTRTDVYNFFGHGIATTTFNVFEVPNCCGLRPTQEISFVSGQYTFTASPDTASPEPGTASLAGLGVLILVSLATFKRRLSTKIFERHD